MIEAQEPRRPCLSCRGQGWTCVTARRVLTGPADAESASGNVERCRDCKGASDPARGADR